VQLHVPDERAVRPVLTGVAILAALRALWPDQFQWRGAGGHFAVDRLAGTDRLRRDIDAEAAPAAIAATWTADEAAFQVTRSRAELYPWDGRAWASVQGGDT